MEQMVNAKNNSGYTALIHAAVNDNEKKCLVHLQSHGANVNDKDDIYGYTLL
jgi:ankyrin repeat protein